MPPADDQHDLRFFAARAFSNEFSYVGTDPNRPERWRMSKLVLQVQRTRARLIVYGSYGDSFMRKMVWISSCVDIRTISPQVQ